MSIDYSKLGLPKGTPRRRVKARQARAEQKHLKTVRLAVMERDKRCRLYWLQKSHGPCNGPLEFAHMHERRRSATRGMAPEERHDQKHAVCLCRFHHGEYDQHRLRLTALSRDGADGALKVTRARTSRESSLSKRTAS